MGNWKSISIGKKDKSKDDIRNSIITREIALKQERVFKLLLFGPGEAGKTTIMRQLRAQYGDGEVGMTAGYRGNICLNVLEGAAYTVKAGRRQFGVSFEGSKEADFVLDTFNAAKGPKTNPAGFNLNDKKLVDCLQKLIAEEDFQYVLSKKSEYQIQDGWEYFARRLEEWPEWGGPDWNPSTEDLLHSRIRTTGRQMVDFTLEGNKYQLIDTGGQQSERKKFFMLKFTQMDAVFFVVSLSEYDQKLFEDNTASRFTETISVWMKTVNSPLFEDTWFILFFNKVDLFKKKYMEDKVPIKPAFPVHSPPPLCEDDDEECSLALTWYQELFESKVKKPAMQQMFRTYFTNALDGDDLKNKIDIAATFLQHQFARDC